MIQVDYLDGLKHRNSKSKMREKKNHCPSKPRQVDHVHPGQTQKLRKFGLSRQGSLVANVTIRPDVARGGPRWDLWPTGMRGQNSGYIIMTSTPGELGRGRVSKADEIRCIDQPFGEGPERLGLEDILCRHL